MGADVLGKVVLLTYEDGKSTGCRLLQALDAPSSSWERVAHPLDLPRLSKEMNEVELAGELVNFIDDRGTTQVSVVSLGHQIPISACTYVAHAVFEYILSNAPVQDSSFTLLIPSLQTIGGSLHDLLLSANKAFLAAFLNGASESTYGVLAGFPRLPATARIHEEFLAVLLHFVHLMGLPTVLLLGPQSQGLQRSKNESQQIINQMGRTLAKQLGLSFAGDTATNSTDTTCNNSSYMDDWRSLYT